MERVLTAKQMRDADNYTINTLGVGHDELVMRAGTAVANEIIKKFQGGRVLVCVGKGNNGEDGKIVAKILKKVHGFYVATIDVSNGIFKIFDKKFDIIVDCIFGTGLNRQVEGKYYTAIQKINQSGSYVISCDIPSGLNADTGFPMGIAVKANMTICIQEYKLGHFLNDGIDYCGKLILKDIGISVWEDEYVKMFTDKNLKEFFPKLKRNVHKGCFPKVAIIGGSINFIGGTILSYNGLASLKVGCGYCTLAVPKSLAGIYATACPECTITPINDNDGKIKYDENALNSLLNYDSIAIGMGLGVSGDVYRTICFLLENYTGKLLIDADALNSLSAYGVDALLNKKCKVVITPHIGEFARISQTNKEIIMADIINSALDFSNKFNVITVLKSSCSVITDGKETFINKTGCSGLAKGGSGDVLSGIILGMLGKDNVPLQSAVAGAYLFGRTSEVASSNSNDYCLVATDVINAMPKVINSL